MQTEFAIAALVMVTVTLALSLAHALEYPGKLRLNEAQYLAVQRIYYPGFSYAGMAEPLAVLLTAALLAATPRSSPRFWLTAGALAATIATHTLYWTLTAPANRIWLKDERLSSGAQKFFRPLEDAAAASDWTVWRGRWERSHVYRALTSATAYGFLLATISIGA